MFQMFGFKSIEDINLEALFTFTHRFSVSREGSDHVIFDEGIASAISEEKSTRDDPLGGDRKLCEKVNKANLDIESSLQFDDQDSAKQYVDRLITIVSRDKLALIEDAVSHTGHVKVWQALRDKIKQMGNFSSF